MESREREEEQREREIEIERERDMMERDTKIWRKTEKKGGKEREIGWKDGSVRDTMIGEK